MKQLYEGLTRLDQEGIPQPALAEKIAISDDQLTYTFHLKKSFWSDGSPLTAHDLKTAWSTALDPTMPCDYAYMLYPIKNAQSVRKGLVSPDLLGVSAIDDQTLVVELESPTPYFLELTAFPTFFPFQAKTLSNGPFMLEKWATQSEIILTKNPHYWDADHVLLDQITFSIISDQNTESQLFETEELDWLGQPISNSIAPELLGRLKSEGKLDSYGIAGTLWFKFNIAKAPFDNLKIRQAFSYAINREEIITHILQGNQQPATGPLPPCMAVAEKPYFTDGAIEEARALFLEGLAEKGWSVRDCPTIVLTYPPSERNSKIVQLVQQQWQKALGISVQLQVLERLVYERHAKEGLFQVGIGQWIADFNDPLAFLEIFKYKIDLESNSGLNDTGWQDERYIALLNDSQTKKGAARKALLADAERLLMEAMPIAPLYHYAFDYVKKPYVQDVVLSPLGIADFKSARITR